MRPLLWTACVLAVSVPACDSCGDIDAAALRARSEVVFRGTVIEFLPADAPARWAANKPATYEFAVHVGCFCGSPEAPQRFRVSGGRVIPLQELDERARRLYDAYDTVDEMFAAIRHAIDQGAEGLDIRYDATFGYPTVANLDPFIMAMDEERRLRIVDFKVIR